MPNAMPEDSENECGDSDSAQQRPGFRTCDQKSTSFEIRNDLCSRSHESAFVDLRSAMEKNEGFSLGNEEEKTKTRFSADECLRPEICSSNIKEYDYIGLSEAATTLGSKSEEGNSIKLGPKTKETELRLGLPEDDELDSGADVTGSSLRSDVKSLNVEATEPPRLDFSVQRGKADEHGPQRCDSVLSCYVNRQDRQEISEHSFVFLKKGSNSVDEAGQTKLEVSPVELSNLSSLKDLRSPLQPGAYDSRFTHGGETQKYWPSPLNNREFSHVVQDYNYRAFQATSKGIASGAKRGFADVLGVNLMQESGVGLPEIDSKELNQPQTRPFTFPWAVTQQYGPANGWQANWEQKNKQNFLQYPRAIIPSVIPDDATNNRFGEAAISTATTQPVAKASNEGQRMPAPVASSSEKIQNPDKTERAPNQSENPPRAPPVVGWPPIRSFRKNLASQPKVAAAAAAAPPCNPPPPAADPGENKINTMFVKVNVDGVPIGRKINLKAYDSYEKLSVALDEMFRGCINAQTSDASHSSENNISQASLLRGSDYVFVYEDNEGDRMLVGDVPWEMFVNTVKRLRVMKSSDARSLANRT